MTNRFNPKRPHRCRSCGHEYTGYQCKCKRTGRARPSRGRARGRNAIPYTSGHAPVTPPSVLAARRAAEDRARQPLTPVDVQAIFSTCNVEVAESWCPRLADAYNQTITQYVPPWGMWTTTDAERILINAGVTNRLLKRADDLATYLNHYFQSMPVSQE